MPTAQERRGDFSETRNKNGQLYNLIYDASTGLPKEACSAAISPRASMTAASLGRIPVNRLYGPGWRCSINTRCRTSSQQWPGYNY